MLEWGKDAYRDHMAETQPGMFSNWYDAIMFFALLGLLWATGLAAYSVFHWVSQ